MGQALYVSSVSVHSAVHGDSCRTLHSVAMEQLMCSLPSKKHVQSMILNPPFNFLWAYGRLLRQTSSLVGKVLSCYGRHSCTVQTGCYSYKSSRHLTLVRSQLCCSSLTTSSDVVRKPLLTIYPMRIFYEISSTHTLEYMFV